MKMTSPIPGPPELDAKQRLIEAGLEIFGILNLEGATTRQLAQRAGVNQAAIPYYFGGKEGLYLAVIEHLLTHKASRVRPLVLQIREDLAKEPAEPPRSARTDQNYLRRLPANPVGRQGDDHLGENHHARADAAHESF